MSIETTYSQARAALATLMSRVTDDREVVVVRRRDHPAVAMIAADELASLMETAHLLRSPANAERLLAALGRARQGSGRTKTVAALRREVGLGD
ncbi:MAG: type II toxin-antitoxin system prevent-host-death family antitoxin [Xanthomonadales bacterium]|nr:type II toxin-antitoxin system prevent-host-death family antitoxin [Xanthomonadales bacterium]